MRLMSKDYGLSMNQVAQLGHAGEAPTLQGSGYIGIKNGWVFPKSFKNEAAIRAIDWPEAEIVQALLDKVDELEAQEVLNV